jgi:predicted hydrolase (HD superfamily)
MLGAGRFVRLAITEKELSRMSKEKVAQKGCKRKQVREKKEKVGAKLYP